MPYNYHNYRHPHRYLHSMTVVTIDQLNDFTDNSFKAQVIQMRELAQTKSGGTWFSFIVDDGTADMKIVVFRDAEKFYPILKMNQWYKFSKVQIQLKDERSKQFDRTQSEYQGQLKATSEIIEIDNPGHQHAYRVNNLNEAKDSGQTSALNLILHTFGKMDIRKSQNSSKNWQYVSIHVVDKLGSFGRLQIWSDAFQKLFGVDDADNVDSSMLENKTVGIYKAIVKNEEKYGMTISLGKTQSIIYLREDDVASKFEDGRAVIDYFIQNGSKVVADFGSPMSPSRHDQNGGMLPKYPKSNLANVENSQDNQAILVLVRLEQDTDNAVYDGCTSCRKRQCSCDKGRRYYYRVNATISDSSDSKRCTFFDKQAESLLGISANDYYKLDDTEKLHLLKQLFEIELHVRFMPAQGEYKERIQVNHIIKEPKYVDWVRWLSLGDTEEIMGATMT